MRNIILLISIFILNFKGYAQNIEMSGVIIDSETNKPIEFVNIGVKNNSLGCVTNFDGKFNLNVTKEYFKDSITISHINYFPIQTAIKKSGNQIFSLKPRTNELSVIMLTSRKKRNKKIGVKSYNKLLWLGGISTDNDIIENSQRINIPKGKIYIKFVNIYLRKGFESDSSYVRINFYKNDNNAPGKRLVFKNIIQKKNIQPGWLQLDITNEYIYVEENFFIGVEFLPNFKKPLDVYVGAILTKGKGYSRRNSQGKWNKLQGASSINVEIEY